MKHFIIICLTAFLSLPILAETSASIQFETKLHDFGEINEDDKTATCVFTFRNTGDAPLIIHKAVASCGCTTPEFTKEPVAPGASGTVKVTYNTVGRPNAFHKTITIYSNDPKTPTTILSIKGNVIPSANNPELSYPKNMDGLRLNKTQLSILDARVGSIRTEKINIINTNSKAVRLSFKKVPSHIRVVASNAVLQPKEAGSITVTYMASQAKDYGRREDYFYLIMNNNSKDLEKNRINVSAYITEDFTNLSTEQRQDAPIAVYSENRLSFGKMAQKERKVQFVTLTNNGKNPLFIRKIVPEYDGLKITPEKQIVPAGKSIKIKMDFNAGTFNGNVVQRATIFTNDPKNSISRLFVTAQVTPVN